MIRLTSCPTVSSRLSVHLIHLSSHLSHLHIVPSHVSNLSMSHLTSHVFPGFHGVLSLLSLCLTSHGVFSGLLLSHTLSCCLASPPCHVVRPVLAQMEGGVLRRPEDRRRATSSIIFPLNMTEWLSWRRDASRPAEGAHGWADDEPSQSPM